METSGCVKKRREGQNLFLDLNGRYSGENALSNVQILNAKKKKIFFMKERKAEKGRSNEAEFLPGLSHTGHDVCKETFRP